MSSLPTRLHWRVVWLGLACAPGDYDAETDRSDARRTGTKLKNNLRASSRGVILIHRVRTWTVYCLQIRSSRVTLTCQLRAWPSRQTLSLLGPCWTEEVAAGISTRGCSHLFAAARGTDDCSRRPDHLTVFSACSKTIWPNQAGKWWWTGNAWTARGGVHVICQSMTALRPINAQIS